MRRRCSSICATTHASRHTVFRSIRIITRQSLVGARSAPAGNRLPPCPPPPAESRRRFLLILAAAGHPLPPPHLTLASAIQIHRPPPAVEGTGRWGVVRSEIKEEAPAAFGRRRGTFAEYSAPAACARSDQVKRRSTPVRVSPPKMPLRVLHKHQQRIAVVGVVVAQALHRFTAGTQGAINFKLTVAKGVTT